MSLINDALKRAQQHSPPPAAPPVRRQAAPPVPPPAARPSSPVAGWLFPAILIFLVVAAVFAVGWASAHRSVTRVSATPEPMAAAMPAEAVQASAPPPISPSAPAPAPAAPAVSPVPAMVVNPANAPKLQGIFYSPTTPSAIIDGQTVRPGDHFLQFHVKEITRNSVTLTKTDGSAIRLGMGH